MERAPLYRGSVVIATTLCVPPNPSTSISNISGATSQLLSAKPPTPVSNGSTRGSTLAVCRRYRLLSPRGTVAVAVAFRQVYIYIYTHIHPLGPLTVCTNTCRGLGSLLVPVHKINHRIVRPAHRPAATRSAVILAVVSVVKAIALIVLPLVT